MFSRWAVLHSIVFPWFLEILYNTSSYTINRNMDLNNRFGCILPFRNISVSRVLRFILTLNNLCSVGPSFQKYLLKPINRMTTGGGEAPEGVGAGAISDFLLVFPLFCGCEVCKEKFSGETNWESHIFSSPTHTLPQWLHSCMWSCMWSCEHVVTHIPCSRGWGVQSLWAETHFSKYTIMPK